MRFAMPPVDRDQLVLFTTRLDEVLPPDHLARDLIAILSQLDWSKFEAAYSGVKGAKAVHPRVIATLIIYGYHVRVRSSRQLEKALNVRVDFMWIAQREQLDHSTFCNFRKDFAEQLADINTQYAVIAKLSGITSLTDFNFDGTRIYSHNGKHRSVDVAKLDEVERELKQKFLQLEREVAELDAEEELFESKKKHIEKQQRQSANKLAAIERAKAEIERAKQANEPLPKRVPLTDPESRITPNKHGGFAPNYTPTALVDHESGLILDAHVLPNTDEEQHLLGAIDRTEKRLEQAELDVKIKSLGADGKFVTGPNLEDLAARGTTLYAPIEAQPEVVRRPDGSVPIAAEHRAQLPTKLLHKAKDGSPEVRQLCKRAFLYDKQQDCYWCPQGQRLSYQHKTSEVLQGAKRRVEIGRYKSEVSACVGCPLRELCLQKGAEQRTLRRDQHEGVRDDLRERMQTEAAQQRKRERQTEGERPFAVVKEQFGMRQFLTCGLKSVKAEWSWATTAANTQVMVRWLRADRLELTPSSSRERAGVSRPSVCSAPPETGSNIKPLKVGM